MRARDLTEDYPAVRLADDALAAVRMLAEQRRPDVVVVDADGHPVTVLAGSQVLRFVVPAYVQDHPSLARVYDERTVDTCTSRLDGRSRTCYRPRGSAVSCHECPTTPRWSNAPRRWPVRRARCSSSATASGSTA